jgi:hypothetical protein
MFPSIYNQASSSHLRILLLRQLGLVLKLDHVREVEQKAVVVPAIAHGWAFPGETAQLRIRTFKAQLQT